MTQIAEHHATTLTYEELAVSLPDLRAYAEQAMLPTIPADLAEALAEHARLTASYHDAVATKDEAQAIAANHSNERLASVTAAALRRSADPDEAAAKYETDKQQAEQAAQRARGVVAGHRNPLLSASWSVMQLVDKYAPELLHTLEPEIERRAEQVQAARQALARAEGELREAVALGGWISATKPVSGETFPVSYGLKLAGD